MLTTHVGDVVEATLDAVAPLNHRLTRDIQCIARYRVRVRVAATDASVVRRDAWERAAVGIAVGDVGSGVDVVGRIAVAAVSVTQDEDDVLRREPSYGPCKQFRVVLHWKQVQVEVADLLQPVLVVVIAGTVRGLGGD